MGRGPTEDPLYFGAAAAAGVLAARAVFAAASGLGDAGPVR